MIEQRGEERGRRDVAGGWRGKGSMKVKGLWTPLRQSRNVNLPTSDTGLSHLNHRCG